MAHEQSETVQLANGKWTNVYGRDTSKAGEKLPDEREYDSVEEAVRMAQRRSRIHGLHGRGGAAATLIRKRGDYRSATEALRGE